MVQGGDRNRPSWIEVLELLLCAGPCSAGFAHTSHFIPCISFLGWLSHILMNLVA